MIETTVGFAINSIKTFIERLKHQYKSFADDSNIAYNLSKINNNKIELRTDSLLYDLIYDPSTGDVPSFGYEIQGKFHKMLKSIGWHSEAQGQGILMIYRRDE